MKNLFLLTLSLFLVNCAFAQVEITLQPIPSTGYADLDVPSSMPYDVKAHATITNTSSEMKTYVWVKKTISKPEKWGIAVCDVNGCYSASLDSTDFSLGPNESGILDIHAYPSGSPNVMEGGVPGVGVVDLVVVEVGNEANTITGEYTVTIDPLVSSLTVQEINALQLFPNPTAANFQLKGDASIKQVRIYNALGQEMRQEQHNIGKTYDIADLQEGLYFVAMQDEENQVLKTVRLQKL